MNKTYHKILLSCLVGLSLSLFVVIIHYNNKLLNQPIGEDLNTQAHTLELNQNTEQALPALLAAIKQNQQSIEQLQQQIQTLNLAKKSQVLKPDSLRALPQAAQNDSHSDPLENDVNSNDISPEQKIKFTVNTELQRKYDPVVSNRAITEAMQTLTQYPDINLMELNCTEQFCKAVLFKMNEDIEISALFGSPPFLNSGITIVNDDGTEELYFLTNKGSLEDLMQMDDADVEKS